MPGLLLDAVTVGCGEWRAAVPPTCDAEECCAHGACALSHALLLPSLTSVAVMHTDARHSPIPATSQLRNRVTVRQTRQAECSQVAYT
jgi:hypothetical protein